MPPKVMRGEKAETYMSRCVREMKKEGMSGAEATDMCYAVYQGHQTKKKTDRRKRGERKNGKGKR